jgi:transposase
VVKIACMTPDAEQQAFHQRPVWSQQAIRDELARTTSWRMSRSSVQRVLGTEGMRPHRVRQWVHSPAEDFAERAAEICDLYLDPPSDAVVVCIDEKPIQVLGRSFPSHADGKGWVRFEYEYNRNGLAYLLGAFDVKTGKVIGKMVKRRTAKSLLSFLRQLARRFPERRVIVVWDNLNTHYDGKDGRWTKFNREHGGRFEFRYTPKHASWLNQIEVWFSILQRRILRYGSFATRAALDDAILTFIRYYNRRLAKPLNWTFNGSFIDDDSPLAA